MNIQSKAEADGLRICTALAAVPPFLPGRWNIYLESLLGDPADPPTRRGGFQKLSDEAYQALFYHNVVEFRTALHWFIRLEWQSSHAVPGKRSTVSACKATGAWLQSIAHLCEKSHPHALHHKCPEMWFHGIVVQFFYCGTQNIWLQCFPVEESKYQALPAKRLETRLLREAIRRAGSLEEIPANQSFEFGKLLAAAIVLSTKNNQFYRNVYKPFLQASREVVNLLDSPIATLMHAEKDGLYQQLGAGRGRKKV